MYSEDQNIVSFWAKTVDENHDSKSKLSKVPGVSVKEHCYTSGCVSKCIVHTMPLLLNRFEIDSNTIGGIVGIHDTGKISPGFQQKSPVWLSNNGLEKIASINHWDTDLETDHGKVSHAAVERILIQSGVQSKTARCIATLVGAHHGRLKGLPTIPMKELGVSEPVSGIEWDKERKNFVLEMLQSFSVDLSKLSLKEKSPAFLWLAGLTTVSDWIASDANKFPAEGGLDNSEIIQRAKSAVEQIGFGLPTIVPDVSFDKLFGFTPNDLQIKAANLIKGPGVYVIEAPMGIGKTEAALWASYQLLAHGKASGIYFALPTQTTSNRIHERLKFFVSQIAPTASASQLIHGTSWLDLDTNITTENWFTSSKRSLLAPFGVGTVDQALLGVVAAKHFFVRHFALAGKVVILDEIHSYDMYTGTLIDQLVKVLKSLGCTIIILSATLTGKRRSQLVSGTEETKNSNYKELSYPLISSAPENETPVFVSSDVPPIKTIDVVFESSQEAMKRAAAFASQGGAVLFVCNTIDRAISMYRKLARACKGTKVGILQSRFPSPFRKRIEEEWMTRLGKDPYNATHPRCGCILVSTQIVEQSVDIGACLLITENAPTDMLLQRLGRLQRHSNVRYHGKPTIVIIEDDAVSFDVLRSMSKEDIEEALGSNGYVYSPYVLLRSLQAWKKRKQINIPVDIRPLIEETYEDFDADPSAWKSLKKETQISIKKYENKAKQSLNIFQSGLEDEEGIQTRLNETPQVKLVLCTKHSDNDITLLNGDRIIIDKKIRLETKKSIHRNLVNVPKNIFKKITEDVLDNYLFDNYAIGCVAVSGNINVLGLRPGHRLHWSEDEGVSIVRPL